MDQAQALPLLQTLAEGIDPHSGAVFPAESPYQHPDVVRALYAAIDALRSSAKRTAPARAAKAGQPWTQEEGARLLAAYDAGQSLEVLAEAHGRSRLGIEARLAKFGKIAAPGILPSQRNAKQILAAYTP